MTVGPPQPPSSLAVNPPGRSPVARLKTFFKKLALLGGTLAVLLLVLEGATRLLTNTAPPIMERDARVGQRFIRSFQGTAFDEETGRAVPLRLNREGLRGTDLPEEKPAGVRRLAFFGDSMIASVSLEESQTMAAQLERMLNQSSGNTRWEVLNCGICGSSTGQEMLLYREVVARYQPDIVLCGFFVGNDLTDNSRQLSNSPRIYFDLDSSGQLVQMPFSASRRAVSAWLNRYSRFYVWQRTAINRARHRMDGTLGVMTPGDWIYSSQESPEIVHAWDISAALLKQFSQEVERQGSLFAVVLIPSATSVCDDCFQVVKQRAGSQASQLQQDYPEQRLEAICRKSHIPFWSMTPDFRTAAPHANSTLADEQLFLAGVGHWNERGSTVAARSVHRFLREGDPQNLAGIPYLQRVR